MRPLTVPGGRRELILAAGLKRGAPVDDLVRGALGDQGIGTASTGVGSAALGRSHADDARPRRFAVPAQDVTERRRDRRGGSPRGGRGYGARRVRPVAHRALDRRRGAGPHRRLAGVAHYAGVAVAARVRARGGRARRRWPTSCRFATEQVGAPLRARRSPGVLQSTLGNLPELFVVIFALHAGEVVVAQTSIIGSLFANALLVLGAVIVVGARAAGRRSCASARGCRRTPRRCCSSPSFIIVVVGISLASHDPASHHVQAVSTVAAVALLRRLPRVGRAATCAPTQPRDDARAPEARGPASSRSRCRSTLLALAGAGRRVRRRTGSSRALRPDDRPARHLRGVRGPRDRRDRRQRGRERRRARARRTRASPTSRSRVVKNSVAQIAAFLFPVLVLVSLLFSHRLTLRAGARLHRRAAAVRARGLADHRRRRGGRVRGLGADRALRRSSAR